MLKTVSSGVDDVINIGKAINEKDFIKALLIMIDMNLKTLKDKKSIITFGLEESKPPLRFVRESLLVFFSKEDDDLEFPEKLKVVGSSWISNMKDSTIITKEYFELLMEDIRSGNFLRNLKKSLSTILKTIKRFLSIFFKKRH